MGSQRPAGSSAVATARNLYLVSMAVFVVTITIGILNGADAVEFDRNQILTHVHSGTIGWITLSLVATAFLLFGAADRRLATAVAILVPVYVGAFYTGSFQLRAIAGSLLLVVIVWLFAWLWRTYLASSRTLPRLGMTLGLTTFTYGAIVGVLLQIQFAAELTILSGDAVGAHAAAMTFGYLVLVAMGLIEWRARDTQDLPRSGVVQLGALFVGGLILSVGLLVGAGQAAGGLYLLTQIVAVILFVVRVLPRSVRTSWLGADPARHVAIASIWVVVALALFMYIVALFISSNDVNAIPAGALIASDHSVFIGVITNLILAFAATVGTGIARWSIGRHLVFWGVNGGLAVFVVGLIAESAEIKRIGAPVMGFSLLLGLALLAVDLWQARATAE